MRELIVDIALGVGTALAITLIASGIALLFWLARGAAQQRRKD
jgi:hypothetical protein